MNKVSKMLQAEAALPSQKKRFYTISTDPKSIINLFIIFPLPR